jgi:hypothetical protein
MSQANTQIGNSPEKFNIITNRSGMAPAKRGQIKGAKKLVDFSSYQLSAHKGQKGQHTELQINKQSHNIPQAQ